MCRRDIELCDQAVPRRKSLTDRRRWRVLLKEDAELFGQLVQYAKTGMTTTVFDITELFGAETFDAETTLCGRGNDADAEDATVCTVSRLGVWRELEDGPDDADVLQSFSGARQHQGVIDGQTLVV